MSIWTHVKVHIIISDDIIGLSKEFNIDYIDRKLPLFSQSKDFNIDYIDWKLSLFSQSKDFNIGYIDWKLSLFQMTSLANPEI